MVPITSIRIALVDLDQAVASYFPSCFAQANDLDLIGSSPTLAHFQQKVNQWVPDVVITAVSSIAQVVAVRLLQPRLTFIALLPQAAPLSQVITALQLGAHGYVRADDLCPNICQRVREIAHQRTFLEPPVIQDLVQQRPPTISTKEQQILGALVNNHYSIAQVVQHTQRTEDDVLRGLFTIITRMHS